MVTAEMVVDGQVTCVVDVEPFDLLVFSMKKKRKKQGW
jgi:hypothetical protein